MRNICFLLFCLLLNQNLFGQDKISVSLTKGYGSQRMGDFDIVISGGDTILFSWNYSVNDYNTFINKMEGDLEVYLSSDTTFSEEDLLIHSHKFSSAEDNYFDDSITIQAPAGIYYLLSRIKSKDTAKFTSHSNWMRQSLMITRFTFEVDNAQISDIKISEYERKTELTLALSSTIQCCWSKLGDFSLSAEVYLGSDDEGGEFLASFYEDLKPDGITSRYLLKAPLYTAKEWKSGQDIIVKIDGYFSNIFLQVDDLLTSTELTVISDIAQINQERSEEYPFLTYGDFEIDIIQLGNTDLEQVINQARDGYDALATSLYFMGKGDYTQSLAFADSAFSQLGRNAVSTLLYHQPGVLSNVYGALFEILEEEDAFTAPYTMEALNFRLGEAMDMESLMESAYDSLSQLLLPDDLDIASEVEASGYFDEDSNFDVAVITENPIFWKEASLPSLEHFMRIPDLEMADRIIANIDLALDVTDSLVNSLAGYPTTKFEMKDIGDYLVDYSKMLDYYKVKLRFYTLTGNSEEGLDTYRKIFRLHSITSQSFPYPYYKEAGTFFESFHRFEQADSLYQIADQYLNDIALEYKKGPIRSKWKLRAFNHQTLALKRGVQLPRKEKEEYISDLRILRDKGNIIDYLEVMNQVENARKIGFTGQGNYPDLYQYNLERMETQGQYLETISWYKDLAYFLGRDKLYEAALNVYESYFALEQLNLRAFRASFSEEAQVLYGKKVLDELGRSVNLLLYARDSLSADRQNTESINAFERALYLHSFVLRGNNQLLYKVLNSDAEEIAIQYEAWKAYKLLLNEAYLRDDVAEKTIKDVRKQIDQTEQDMVRALQDSSSIVGQETISFEDIQAQLKPGEAAIEILRTVENHRIYYGDTVRYIASIVLPDSKAPLLIPFPTNGTDLENRIIRFYRSAIQFKVSDTLSYHHFWEPIDKALPKSTERIYFAPDGVFHLINPVTLFDTSTEKQLIDKYSIQTLPTLSVLGNEGAAVSLNTARLYGFPSFIDQPSAISPDHRAFGRNSLLRNEISPLPGTLQEVLEIEKLLVDAGRKVKVFTEEEVNKRNILNPEEVDILHIATHGFWTSNTQKSYASSLYESMSQSGLILSGAQERNSSGITLNRKGLITAAEIQDMFLFNTKLVVLSACETGLGEIVPGEGIFGLKRAFQKAGTENLITTLWKVDDEATQQFMVNFYESLLQENTLSQAFSLAQQKTRELFPEPYYWGVFVLTKFY